jgi:hypothetical protein
VIARVRGSANSSVAVRLLLLSISLRSDSATIFTAHRFPDRHAVTYAEILTGRAAPIDLEGVDNVLRHGKRGLARSTQ